MDEIRIEVLNRDLGAVLVVFCATYKSHGKVVKL